MCWWAAVAQVATQAIGIANQNSARANMAGIQAEGYYKQMNYSFQNYEIQRQDAYDAAVDEILKTRINQQQLNSQVNAAIMEGYQGGGRTAGRLMRAAEADTARTVSSIQDNFMRKSSEIDLNKEQTLLSTNNYLENLKEQYKPNKWADILNLAATGIQGYNAYKNYSTMSKVVGGDFDFWGSKMGDATQLSSSPSKYVFTAPNVVQEAFPNMYSPFKSTINDLTIKTGGFM